MLSAVVVGVAMTALITLLYSSTKVGRYLSFGSSDSEQDGHSNSFMLDETSTDASGNEV